MSVQATAVQSFVQQSLATCRFIAQHPLCRGRVPAAFARYIRWQIESRLFSEIDVQWIEGAKLIAKHGMTGATGNIYCGLHEFVEMAFLLHVLRPGDLFLDVGANVGSYTVLASKVCGARTIAFEPDPDAARALRRNIGANRIGDLAEICEVALGNWTGDAWFTSGFDTMNHVALPEDKGKRRVPMRRLDDLVDAAPTLIKLDTEGAEEDILAGASRILGVPSLIAVQAELCSDKVVETLTSFGFTTVFYDPFERRLSSSPFDYQSCNSLFIRSDEAVSQRIRTAPLRNVIGHRL
jgi:FkbM family methyltransferase